MGRPYKPATDPRGLSVDTTESRSAVSKSDVFFDRIVPAILAGAMVVWTLTFAELVLDFVMHFPG